MENSTTPASNTKKILLYVGLAVLVIAAGVGTYFWQDGRVATSNSEIARLKAEKETLSKDKGALEEKNKNLSTSVTVLQKQISSNATTSQSTQQTNDPTAPTIKATTKLTVSSVKNVSGSEFEKAGYAAPKGNFKAIYATITNISNQEQSYEINQFTAVTKAGAIIPPQIFSPAETVGLWNNSKLAAGDKQDIVLLFSQDQDIIVLTHSAGPTSVSLPSVQ